MQSAWRNGPGCLAFDSLDERFQQGERLRKSGEIREVLSRKGSAGRFMTVHLKDGLHPHSRFAVIAARVVGNAVARNRAKRRMREAFRRNKRCFGRAVDMVVRVKPAIADASYGEIESDFLTILHSRRLIDEPPLPPA